MIIYNDELTEKVENLKKRNRIEEIILDLEKSLKKREKEDKDKNNSLLLKLRNLKEALSKLNISDDSHKKYLAEIILEEKPQFENNTLILSPVGSGKTTLIKEVLIDKKNINKTLILVSNRFLKDSMYETSNNDKDNSVKLKTTKSKKQGDEEDSVYMMTYHEFGLKIRDNNEFMNKFTTVFCDEIHSLPEYREYKQGPNGSNYPLEHALKYLFSRQEGKQIYYFTATDHTFNVLKEKRPSLVKDVKVVDYREHPDIKKYMELSKSYITHIDQIRPFLKDRIESFNYFKSKGVAYARTIGSLKKIESILIEEGYSPLVLWSDANEENELDKTQIAAREELISTGEIPSGYNFLVMNSALREGWDLNDPSVRLMIMNSTNETDVIQARGRVRKDIDLIMYRTTDELDVLNLIQISDEYLNKPLNVDNKNKLCDVLNITDQYGRKRKWRAIKGILQESGYEIEDTRITLDGKRQHVSIIRAKQQD